ncbi:MAG: sigma-70 family RNA polymerase sigma factor [Ruminococcus sp.]|nr:sigma-70 family RNA polymerase sigma factor [Ruminococcus sp.]
MTDSRLRALMEKSPEAGQRALFDEYCGYVYAIAAARLKGCGTAEDVEECVADAFLDIFSTLEKNSFPDGELTGIIGTIARRRAIDTYRRLSLRSSRSVALDDIPYPGTADDISVEDETELSETRRIVLAQIERLGKKDRLLLIHYYYYGRTLPQIARTLGISESAVQKRLQRARKKLRPLLEKAGIDEEW